ncbi:MAG: hypothetical protein DMF87_04460 [Acidobacteria bacterium]|nr:MAG: hypothetical protein DMF87_04460 [Acidobacteriota bacterium]
MAGGARVRRCVAKLPWRSASGDSLPPSRRHAQQLRGKGHGGRHLVRAHAVRARPARSAGIRAVGPDERDYLVWISARVRRGHRHHQVRRRGYGAWRSRDGRCGHRQRPLAVRRLRDHRGRQQRAARTLHSANGVTIAGSIIEAAAAMAALFAGWGVVGMLAVIVPVNVLMGMASTVLLKRVASDLRIGWRGANRAAVRRVLSFSSSVFAIETATRLQTKTAEFVIAALATLDAVTPYALARRLGDVAEMVAIQFLKVVMPLASELHASEHGSKLRTLYIVSSRIALAISVPVAVVLTVIGGKILALWVGPAYGHYAGLVALLAVSRLIASSQWPASEILLGMTKHRMVAATALTSGVLHVVLGALLLPSFGLTGVAVGGLIPNVIASLCIIMPFATRTLRVSVGTAIREIWAPTAIPGVAAAAVLWMLQYGSVSPSLPAVLTWVAASLLVFAIGYVSMPACHAERHLIAEVFAAASTQLRRSTADVRRVA